MSKVLVVDDERDDRTVMTRLLRGQGLEVVCAENGWTALDAVKTEVPALVILDIRMPGLGGMETLRELKAIVPQVPVIMFTGHGDVPTAVEAIRLGACDYLTKSLDKSEICLAVQRALERQPPPADGESLRVLMGPSREIEKVIQQVNRVAGSTFTVLIEGETGAGKELVARAIHEQSDRRVHPFIALDCGAIPETLIESELFGYERGAFTGADRRKEGHFQIADGGSLFLDEVANLPATTQAKLLRTLQERQVQPLGGKRPVPVNVRIIAASNLPLENEMRAGRFRPDLYYRLSEFTITVPPLRERREDILYLAKRFLEEASAELQGPVHGISEAAARRLLEHSWPGNARELRNIIRQAVLLGKDIIGPEHLEALNTARADVPSARAPGPGPAKLALREAREGAERQAIWQALLESRGNKSEAARLLRTDFKTLHVKMKRYGIRVQDFPHPQCP